MDEAPVPIPLRPPLRPFRAEDAGVVARLNSMASHGILLTVWQRLADGGDPWAVGTRRQIERMEQGQTLVVADRGSGAEAVLMGNPIPLEEVAVEDVPAEFRALVELQRLVSGSWHINVIATLPEARRQGTGRLLMETADRLARAGGHSEISLITLDENADAIRLYRSLGYIERARRPLVPGTWDGHAKEWVLMGKRL